MKRNLISRTISVILLAGGLLCTSACNSPEKRIEKISKKSEKYVQAVDYVMVYGADATMVKSNVYGEFVVTDYEIGNTNIDDYLGGDSNYLYYAGWKDEGTENSQRTIWRIPLANPCLELVCGYDYEEYVGAFMATSTVYVLYQEVPKYEYLNSIIPGYSGDPDYYEYQFHAYEVGTDKEVGYYTDSLSCSSKHPLALTDTEKGKIEALFERVKALYSDYSYDFQLTEAQITQCNDYLKELAEDDKVRFSNVITYDLNLKNGSSIQSVYVRSESLMQSSYLVFNFLIDQNQNVRFMGELRLPQKLVDMYPV